VTWKQKGIRHDANNGRVRLSKGANHKQHPRAWEYILVEYETRPGVTVENLQQVRAVYDKAKRRWELHLVCKHARSGDARRSRQRDGGYRPWHL